MFYVTYSNSSDGTVLCNNPSEVKRAALTTSPIVVKGFANGAEAHVCACQIEFGQQFPRYHVSPILLPTMEQRMINHTLIGNINTMPVEYPSTIRYFAIAGDKYISITDNVNYLEGAIKGSAVEFLEIVECRNYYETYDFLNYTYYKLLSPLMPYSHGIKIPSIRPTILPLNKLIKNPYPEIVAEILQYVPLNIQATIPGWLIGKYGEKKPLNNLKQIVSFTDEC